MEKWQYHQIVFILIMPGLILTLMGCGQTKSMERHVKQNEMTYTLQELDSTDIRGSIYKVYSCNEYVYIIANRWATKSNENVETEDVIYRMQAETKKADEFPITQYTENAQIQSIGVDGQGNLYALLETYDDRSGNAIYQLLAVDQNGKYLAQADITKDYVSGTDFPEKILVNTKGEIVVTSSQLFCLYNNQLKKTGEVVAETGVDACAVSSEGLFLCGSKDDKGIYVKALDYHKKSFGKRHDINLQTMDQTDCLINGANGWDFYYRDSSGIYGYSLKDNSVQKIMDYLLSDTVSDNILCLTITEEGKVIGAFYDTQGEDKLLCYVRQNAQHEKQKTTIRVGVLSMDILGSESTILNNAVVAFNGNSDHYRVEIVDYQDGQSRLNADIAAGKQPDILYLDDEAMPLDAYITQGVFEDLTTYYDLDNEIGTGDILEPFYNALQMDGGIYYISPYFCLQTVVGSKEVTGDRTGWSYEKFEEILSKQQKNACPFRVQNKNEMLDTLLTGQINDYIDWKTGECQFDSEEFCNILRLCNDMEINSDYNDEDGIDAKIKDGNILFLQGVFSLPEEVLDRALYQTDISVVGYPCKDQKGTYYIPQLKFGLSANSKEKQGAWEFLRTFMTKNFQGKLMDEDIYMPTRQDCYTMWKRRMTATEPYVDDLGQEIQPYTLTGEGVNITGIPIEDMNTFDRVIQNTTKIYHCDSAIRTIINEEAAGYFNGQRSVDETAKIIQNRVTTYVNESR